MKHINWLGLGFMLPAATVILFFFLIPVIMTVFFAFTNMSTSTGIRGGEYMITQSNLRRLADSGADSALLEQLESAGYVIDETGLQKLEETFSAALADEFAELHANERFDRARDVERALKDLSTNRIRTTRERKAAAALFQRSLLNERFENESVFRTALTGAEIPAGQHDLLVKDAYTGWTWTKDNFKLLFSLPSTWRIAVNTAIYVSLTLCFNVSFGLFLAISTFYLPSRLASTFRTIWFMPRILPPVLYVLMWKWFTWDTGFLSSVGGLFGFPAQNWMLHTSLNAWVVVILINGFVGASLGMILFSSAIKAIPSSMLYASEVDGANRFQQVRHIILPQLRWPILFITSYQTLSLLTSFEFILLATDGGPGGATEVWALAAFHTALNNYGGNQQYGYGAAFALILVIIGILASFLYLRLFSFNELVSKPQIEQ